MLSFTGALAPAGPYLEPSLEGSDIKDAVYTRLKTKYTLR